MLRKNRKILPPMNLIKLKNLSQRNNVQILNLQQIFEIDRERERTNESKIAYNKQRNACVSLLHKNRKGYFVNLDTKIVKDNRKFGKTVNPLFLEKSYSKESTCLMQK